MEFKKVTISLPKVLYEEGVELINKGFFSNFSDLVRSGIRSEFKELQPVIKDFDEKVIYGDKDLIVGVKQSMAESLVGKGRIVRAKDVDNYFEAI